MIVNFDATVCEALEAREDRIYWVGVLWKLVKEFDPDISGLYHRSFHEWLYANWKITVILDRNRPDFLLGVDIDDSSVSMLLLKYPLSDLSS